MRKALAGAARKAHRKCMGIKELDSAFVAAVVFFLLASGYVFRAGTPLEALMFPDSWIRFPELDETSRVLHGFMDPHPDDSAPSEPIALDPSQFESLKVREYRVVAGDTLSGIANRNNLRIDTLVSFNQINDVRRMQIGDVIKIPNRNGILYNVKRGDSLESIAETHNVSVNALLDANDMVNTRIGVGEVLFVPGAQMNQTELRLALGELFRWPVRGRFTSGFGMRNDPFTGLRRFHNGIDIANATGTAITAAMHGRVVHIETQSGNYGRFVILRHDAGFQTLYAHLHTVTVRTGQYVSQGQTLGTMGNTGRSTAPHLHFSVIRNGAFVDPLRYLY
jgi:murein DD-endopeptidase MepM/ murein hydrolase activator NlpD